MFVGRASLVIIPQRGHSSEMKWHARDFSQKFPCKINIRLRVPFRHHGVYTAAVSPGLRVFMLRCGFPQLRHVIMFFSSTEYVVVEAKEG